MRIFPSEQEVCTSHLDRSAQRAAIRAHIPELRIAARNLVDGAGIAPDELVRKALVAALRGLIWLPPGADLKPWLLGILSDPGLVERAEQLGAPPVKCR
jgi:DNA-directed RNA polymerase specialized sigma24 family protein